jgi:hypothetical protein
MAGRNGSLKAIMRHGEELAELGRRLRSPSERRARLEACGAAPPDRDAHRLLVEACIRDETLAREALLRAVNEWERPARE